MKIATFLLTESKVVPFANNAKFIKLTEAYDLAYAAVAAVAANIKRRRAGLSEQEEIDEIFDFNDEGKFDDEGKEEWLAAHTSKVELSVFLAYSVFEKHPRRTKAKEDRRLAKAELDEIDASQEDVETAIDKGKVYDYDTKDSYFRIEDYHDSIKLRLSFSFFKEAIDAYEEGNIFDLAEDDKSYDVRLAIDNFTNLSEIGGYFSVSGDGGYFSPPSFDDPMSEDEKEAFFGEK